MCHNDNNLQNIALSWENQAILVKIVPNQAQILRYEPKLVQIFLGRAPMPLILFLSLTVLRILSFLEWQNKILCIARFRAFFCPSKKDKNDAGRSQGETPPLFLSIVLPSTRDQLFTITVNNSQSLKEAGHKVEIYFGAKVAAMFMILVEIMVKNKICQTIIGAWRAARASAVEKVRR